MCRDLSYCIIIIIIINIIVINIIVIMIITSIIIVTVIIMIITSSSSVPAASDVGLCIFLLTFDCGCSRCDVVVVIE